LREVSEEMIALSQKGKGKRKREQPQPKETVKGNIGEIAASRQFKQDGIIYVDANRVIAKNIAGIDHIINYRNVCFSQSKVHIDGTLLALLRAYQTDIANRGAMVQLFIRKIVQKNKLAALREANTSVGGNPTLTAIIKELDENWSSYAEDLSEIDDTLRAVQLAKNAIIFPVPGDVYDSLGHGDKLFAYKLQYDTIWFLSSLRKSHYMNKKTKLSKKKREELEDPEYKV
jgi:hypothetical protein